jgi:transcriptional regulator with XRE-family HTH domain
MCALKYTTKGDVRMDETFIARRLAKLRTEMGVSARDMSLSMGQSNNYVSNIENGKASPSIQGLFIICGHLKISLKDFFDEGNTNPSLLNELIEEHKPMNSKALEHLLGFVREMRAK